MKPLSIVYWSRLGFALVAASLCVALNVDNIFNGMSVGILFYLISSYIYKFLFVTKVDKSSKLFTQGIFAYFLAWVVFWTLLFTLFHTL